MLRKISCLMVVLLALCAAASAEAALTAFSEGGKWGFKDASGTIVTKPVYLNEPQFAGDYAVARKGNGIIEEGFSGEDEEGYLCGVIDRSGAAVIPFEYDSLEFTDDDQALLAKQAGKYGLLDVNGETLLELKYDYISPFRCSRAYICLKNSDGTTLYGLIDSQGREILPIKYLDVSFAGDDLVEVRQQPNPRFPAESGYMNLDGEWVIPPQYHSANSFIGDYAVVGRYAVYYETSGDLTHGLLHGVINRQGEEVVPLEYEVLTLESDGTTAITCRGQRLRFAIGPDGMKFFYEHEDGSRESLPDWAGDWAAVVPLDSEPRTYLAHWPSAYAVRSWAMLDAEGKVLHAGALDELGKFYDGVAAVCRDGRYGYLKSDGTLLLEPSLKSASPFTGGFGLVQDENELYGYISADGKWLFEPQFEGAYYFENGYARVCVSENNIARWGVIGTNGSFILPLEYGSIEAVSDDGTVEAYKDGETFLFRLTEGGAEEVKTVGSSLSLEDYMPFTGSKVAKLDGEPTLGERASGDHGHPRLDGATALFPVYSAVVEAVYPEKTRYGDVDYDEVAGADTLVTCTKTNRAYERLIEGKADIIFCAGPSEAQLEAAKAAGVEFELTPFGKEAFVFIVNNENPLEEITVEQIRKIYSGEITDWKDLGVEDLGEIVAYQRPENSGSQTALERLMGDIPLMDAPKEYVSGFMEEIIQNVEYRNLANAIGYSFRFFCTEMAKGDVKLLSIDGVAPTVENIRADAYPITSTLYMVTRKGEENPNVQALVDWVLSEQGQELVEKSGYVGIS